MNTNELMNQLHTIKSLAIKARLVAHNPTAFLQYLSRDIELVETKTAPKVCDLMGIPVEFNKNLPSGQAWLVVHDGNDSKVVAIMEYNEEERNEHDSAAT